MIQENKKITNKIRIASVIFILSKDILCFVFGTAIYKWLKELMVIGTLLFFPIIIKAQIGLYSLDSFKSATPNYFQSLKPQLNLNATTDKPFFCKLEDQLNHNKKKYLSIRLGSLEYANQLEYSKYLYKGEQEIPYLK